MGGINPTDMQVMVNNSIDVARQYSQEAHKVIANQQSETQESEKLQDENTKRVHERDKSERIEKDEEENKGRERGKQQDDEERKKEEEEEEKLQEEIKKYYPEVRGHFNKKI